MTEPRKAAFDPVVSAATRVLVLGSLPGEASLAAQRYYAHPANRFWHLAGGVIGRADLPELPYEARLAILLDAGIGLWDTVRSATRAGSLDSALRGVEPAALESLVATLPALKAVGFNGGTSARIGMAQLGAHPAIACVQLPSSSAAYCRITLAQKQDQWNSLRKFLR
ncbi:MAG: hypothetical protein RIS94_3330 [Pseudomonadota bacterium]